MTIRRFWQVLGGYGVLLVILTTGLYSLGWSIVEIRLSQISAAWPSAPGTITSSYIAKGSRQIVPVVKFHYLVQGVEQTGHRIRFGQVPGDLFWAEDVMRRYPTGKIVPVFFDAHDPSNSVLEPSSLNGNTYIAVFAGIALTLVAIGLFFLWRRIGDI